MLHTHPFADRRPQPDPAEFDAYFPSPFSLHQSSRVPFLPRAVRYPHRYNGRRWRILAVCTSERYMEMLNGKLLSTGNHPVATLLPMYHMAQAGFHIDVATINGAPVKLEKWAMPWEDELVTGALAQFRHQLRRPLSLAQVARELVANRTPYLGVFIPGGHGAMLGLPGSLDLKVILDHMLSQRRMIMTICHGPAALLAASIDTPADRFPLRGYSLCAFPDELDQQLADTGHAPGPLPWHLGERLSALGMRVINEDISGTCHLDRILLTGDSPWAADLLGRMAAEALLDMALAQ